MNKPTGSHSECYSCEFLRTGFIALLMVIAPFSFTDIFYDLHSLTSLTIPVSI